MSTLVAYFSAEYGKTKGIAEEFSKSIGADIFEIVPKEPYTKADLRYMNPLARCNREKIGKKDVAVKGTVADFDKYDTVYIGFPIWYGCAPNVINTFCKGYDWKGKAVHAFATSGGSGIGQTAGRLKPYVDGAVSVDAKLVRTAEELRAWKGL